MRSIVNKTQSIMMETVIKFDGRKEEHAVGLGLAQKRIQDVSRETF